MHSPVTPARPGPGLVSILAATPASQRGAPLVTVLGALAMSLALSGCTRADPEALLAEARQQHGRGQLRAAVIHLKNALQEADGFQARRLLGEVYLDDGDALSAEKEFQRALALAPAREADPVRLLIGRALLMQGQHQRVLSQITAGRRNPALLSLRGDALVALGKRAEARAAYEAARAGAPVAPDALLGLARLAVLEQRPDDADALLNDALAAQPGHIGSLRFRSDCLRAAGKPAAALAALQQILALRPDDAHALTDIAGLHSDGGRYEQARRAIARARQVAGATPAVHYASAMLAYREGKLAEAKGAAQQILRALPEHPAALLLAASTDIRLGADEQAARHLKSYLASHPQDLYASKRMAYLHLRAQRTDAALQLLAPLMARHRADSELFTLAGEAHLHARRYQAAASLFEQASALRPNLAALHAELAISRIGSGEHGRAVAELERAVQLDGSSQRHAILLVMAHLRANAPEKALAVAGELARRGDNPLVQNLIGGVHLAARRSTPARAAFERALALEPLYLPALANLAQMDKAASRPEQAVRRYRDALARSPSHPGLLEALAGLASGRGRHQEAIGWLERAVQAAPDQPALALHLAHAHVRAGQGARALVLTRQLVATHPNLAAAVQTLADLQWHGGDADGAATHYRKAAALAPQDPAPYLRLATVELARANPAAARAALQKALALAPDAFDAQLALVHILVAQRHYRDALALAKSVQQRQPASPNGFKLEADIHTAQGQPILALPGYEQAYARAPTGLALLQLHTTLVRLGKRELAERQLHAWLRAHPDDVATRMYHASALMVEGQLARAVVQLDAVLARDPEHVIALNDIAWAHQGLGTGRALGYAERAFRLAPRNASVMDTLAWILAEQGQPGRALPLLKRAAALAPRSAEIGLHLATLLARSGDTAGARRAAEALLAQPGSASRHQAARDLLARL